VKYLLLKYLRSQSKRNEYRTWNNRKLVDETPLAKTPVVNAYIQPGISQLDPGYYKIVFPLLWSPIDSEPGLEYVVDKSVGVDVVDWGGGRVLVPPIHVGVVG